MSQKRKNPSKKFKRDVLGIDDSNPNEKMLGLTAPQLESFDWALEEGLQFAVEDLEPVEFKIENGPDVSVSVKEARLTKPMKGTIPIYPAECREGHFTYSGGLFLTVDYNIDGRKGSKQIKAGDIPVIVKSSKCNLHGFTPSQLVQHNEEENEMGGYFIVGGIERLIRMLILNRGNYVLAVKRSSYKNRGPEYTDNAVIIRSVKQDLSSKSIVLHYLNTGNSMVRFTVYKQDFYVPVVLVLRAIVDTTDREIYEMLVQGDHNSFMSDRVEAILREAEGFSMPLATRKQCLAYLGQLFKVVMDRHPTKYTDEQHGQYLLDRYLFVHLNNGRAKFDLLIFMIQKLYALAAGQCAVDDTDSPMNQEILTSGHMYLIFLKEKLEEYLRTLKLIMIKDSRVTKKPVSWYDPKYFQSVLDRNTNLGQKADYFLATGNLKSPTGLDLMQATGFVIIAEKINFLRYLSHFRCVHRGAFFTEMKTTTVRKLLGASWGFLCPVHTPDGTPCGLLNHIAAQCKVIMTKPDTIDVCNHLTAFGMLPNLAGVVYGKDHLVVMLDGLIIGYIPVSIALEAANRLRYLKTKHTEGIADTLEIGLTLPDSGPQYPGFFLWSSRGRMMRPVKHLQTGEIELIGSFEQVYLNIACGTSVPQGATHAEIQATNMLSLVASCTPFSDLNQSPRNMYQCQMGKQTMGTPCHSIARRSDNKLYRLQTPQSPLTHTMPHVDFKMDTYPTGTNAVVAVIAYTGYDMEDAMILNKGAYDRGFGHASVYKTEKIDLIGKERGKKEYLNNPQKSASSEDRVSSTLDPDGLPPIGMKVNYGDDFYSITDTETDKTLIKKFKVKEPAVVDQVKVIHNGSTGPTKASIKVRFNRNPIVGDKFSSRHGQKGIMSQVYPQEDMPFTESGITPDVIINPNAFPSRMTIGMLIEIMASKSGALHGMYQDATPFRFDEKHTAVDYFGQELLKAGYNYYGSEPMYSGIFGTELRADIFVGVCYYQRLRHMVSDKYQVRSTGPIHNLTRQPVKGRKVGGGIRLGEMERDSLLAHGVSFILHDRLMDCSDAHLSRVCTFCGSIMTAAIRKTGAKFEAFCTFCDSAEGMTTINLPFVYRYLTAELAAMNIRLTLNVK